MAKYRRGETDKDGNPIGGDVDQQALNSAQIRRLLVYLRLDSLPGLFTFIALLGADKQARQQTDVDDDDTTESESESPSRPLEVHGLRILELTERNSSVMHVTEGEEYFSERDPVVNTFRTFSRLNDVAVSGRVAVVPTSSYAETLMKQASDVASDFIIVPWSEYGSVTEDTSVPEIASASERFTNRSHLDFISQVLHRPVSNTGVFINRGFGGALERSAHHRRGHSAGGAVSVHSTTQSPAYLPVKDKTHQIFFPFFGGVDDRAALRLALRLAKNPNVTLTVAHFSWASTDSGDEVDVPDRAVLAGAPAEADIGKDDLKVVEGPSAEDLGLLSTLSHSLPRELVGRVTVSEINVTRGTAVAEAVLQARRSVGNFPKNAGDIVLVGRSHRDLGDESVEIDGGDLRKTVGVVAQQLVDSGVKASLLVIKAGGAGLHW